MTAVELARELARLEGVEDQFRTLVGQLVAARRQQAVRRMISKPDAAPSTVSQDMAVLDRAIEKIAHNLESQYEDFFSAHAAFRAQNLTIDELQQFVDVLSDERVQGYLAKMRSLQSDASMALRQVTERMMTNALVGAQIAVSSPEVSGAADTRL